MGESFAGRVLDALCEYAQTCPLNELGTIDHEGQCRNLIARRGLNLLARQMLNLPDTEYGTWTAVAKEEEAGRITVNEDKAVLCLAAIRASACTGYLGAGNLDQIPDCVAALTGLREDGDTCIADQACASARCSSQTGACGGTCIEPTAEGESCGGDECARGLVCRANSGGNNVCQPPFALGEQCGQCEPGLLCLHNPTENKFLCSVPPSTQGADCSEVKACGGGFTCIDTRPLAICVASPGDGLPCENERCAPNHFCDSSPGGRTCRALGDGSVGSRCRNIDDCDSGKVCEANNGWGSGTCQEPLATGASCEASPNKCADGFRCQGTQDARTCQALPTSGACFDEGNGGLCGAGASCINGVCEVLPTAGQDCLERMGPGGYRHYCAQGTMCDFQSNPKVCVALPGDGEACNNFGQCAFGLYCTDNVCRPPAGPVEDTGAKVGESCGPEIACIQGARCPYEPLTSTSIVCSSGGRRGESCATRGCATGYVCASEACALTFTLQEYPQCLRASCSPYVFRSPPAASLP